MRTLVAVVIAFAYLAGEVSRAQTAGPVPLGRLVDVGGYRVHLYCVGNGSPTVVITGAGYSFDWGLVQPEVAKFTRVCAYDHSGAGWSEPGPPDTCSLRAGEVHTALKNAGIGGPFVLVGHSLGALVARLYAIKFDAEVAGVVIVDHAALAPVQFTNGPFVANGPVPGLRSPIQRPDANAGFERLPERDYELHRWASSLPGAAQVMSRNTQILTGCATDVEAAARNTATPLGGKPLIAVSSPASRQLHAKLLALSSNSKQTIAENSGHYVMIDRPDVVIEAIREVVDAARKHARLEW